MHSYAPSLRTDGSFSASSRTSRYSYDIIDRRLAERRARSAEEKASMGKGDKDLLELFMDLTENREDLLPVVLNFIIAGRDTTAQALSWLFWLLSKHPECVELCRKEIEAVLRQGDGSVRKVNYEDMKNLTYVTACFNEALRLHPSVPK